MKRIHIPKHPVLNRVRPDPTLTTGNDWYRVVNATGDGDDGDTAEVWIYDTIGWDVEAGPFARDLAQITAKKILCRLNTPGGSVFDGIAIYNSLLSHPAHVTVQVDGLAASAGSFIAQAGDRVVMGRNAQMMIHDAAGFCMGNAADMREMADLLDRLSDNIASVYHDRAGGSVEQWRERMLAETWFSGEEAVEAGLADEMAPAPPKRGDDPDEDPDEDADEDPDKEEEPEPEEDEDEAGEDAEALHRSHDLSRFRFPGRNAAPPPAAPAFATGGVVTHAPLVGGQGPEPVAVPAGTVITPATTTAGAGVTVHFRDGAPDLAAVIAAEVKAAITPKPPPEPAEPDEPADLAALTAHLTREPTTDDLLAALRPA